jgi:beta-glucosidase
VLAGREAVEALRHDGRMIVNRRMLWKRCVLAAVVAVTVGALGPVGSARADGSPPFRNPDLPLSVRVDDLVSRLTLDEKISLLHQYEPAIPRLGVPAFRTGTEALHGVAWLGPATVFPQAVGLASTWDPALIQQVGGAVGQEARGFHVQNADFNGLNLWAPVVNLLRDPRWGRNEEGYSEDPYLTGRISTAYSAGIEGPNPTYLQAAPTLKHYLANNNEVNRDTTSSVLPPRILHDYDQQAFQPAISADAATGVMASYNLVNGRPNTVNPDLNSVVRSWTDKQLMVVSDAFAPYNLTGSERYYATQPEADAAAIQAGLDSFTQDNANPAPALAAITSAVQQGLLSVADIENADRHILAVRFRLGDFDPPGRNPYESITPAVINSPAHQQLARQAADEQMVLLKNTGNALPLTAGATGKVAVVGPLSDVVYQDWYSGTLPYQVSPLRGITERLGSGATVASTEGIDRIALRDVATGGYVTGGGGPGGAVLTANAPTAGTAQGLDVNDWGQGIVTLRSAANDRYVTLGGGHTLVNSQTQPNGWFVEQMFKLDQQADGSYVIEFAGYDATESWFGPNRFVVVGADGTLSLGAATAAAATRFSRELVSSGTEGAVAAARGADAAIVVVGSMPFINGREAHDRQSMDLPAGQEALVEAVQKVNPHTILVLQTSYPETITWAQDHVPAIVWTTHAGQETGHAIADVLFADHNPSGRLTQTWYRSTSELPDIRDYDISKTGETYLYHRGAALYPFGYGLSYTTFRYGSVRLSSPSVPADGRVRVSVDVTNTGSRTGTETVQLYTHERRSRAVQPVEQLRGFQRVTLAPHQTRTVTLTLKASDLAFWDVTRSRPVVETGTYDLLLGGSSARVQASAALDVRGERIPARDLSGTTVAETFDDYSGTTLVDATRTSGTAVAATAAGQWIAFTDVALDGGARSVTAQVANASTTPATIEVRLDGPAGRLVGTIAVPATGSRYSWTNVSSALHAVPGRHDVYLVFTGPGELDSIRLG